LIELLATVDWLSLLFAAFYELNVPEDDVPEGGLVGRSSLMMSL
jgi:hypothetical protein